AAGSMSARVESCAWPAERVGEALMDLARHGGRALGTHRAAAVAGARSETPPAHVLEDDELLDRWLIAAAARLGVEAERQHVRAPLLLGLLRGGGPALVRFGGASGGFLALLPGGGSRARL